jgi:hypothetical protein
VGYGAFDGQLRWAWVDRTSPLPLSVFFLLSFARIIVPASSVSVGSDQGRIGHTSTRVFDQSLLLALLDDPAEYRLKISAAWRSRMRVSDEWSARLP